MPDTEAEAEARTNLSVPVDLKRRIEALAAVDLRPYKQQLLVLLEEAVSSRERRK